MFLYALPLRRSYFCLNIFPWDYPLVFLVVFWFLFSDGVICKNKEHKCFLLRYQCNTTWMGCRSCTHNWWIICKFKQNLVKFLIPAGLSYTYMLLDKYWPSPPAWIDLNSQCVLGGPSTNQIWWMDGFVVFGGTWYWNISELELHITWNYTLCRLGGH
jgi:hypothetical protein